MRNLAKPIMKKFLLALLTTAALSGAVLVPHSSAAAEPDACNGFYLHICPE
jgi:hypothetical protein